MTINLQKLINNSIHHGKIMLYDLGFNSTIFEKRNTDFII